MLLREQIAGVQHEIWSHWMQYLFSVSHANPDGSFTIPADKVRHWHRQMNTPYLKLSESEKDSDREQADKILEIIRVA